MMLSEAKKTVSDRLFQLKGTSFTLTVLELYSPELEHFESVLRQKILQAPLFFRSTPIVIDLQKLKDPDGELDLNSVVETLRNNSLVPVAIRGGDPAHQTAALALGLGTLSAKRREEPEEVVVSAEKEVSQKEPHTIQPTSSTRVITKQVRSGQQIYAQGGDLLILASVSVGAEIIADGHIHVYAPLRGRALAGVSGNTDARIFCTHLESELVSIAGYYKLSDQLKTSSCWGGRAHVFLDNKNLRIEPLS